MKNSADALKAQNEVLAEQVRHAKRQDRLEGIERAIALISASIDNLLNEKFTGGYSFNGRFSEHLDSLAASFESLGSTLTGRLQEIERTTHPLVSLFDDLAWSIEAYRANSGSAVVPALYWRRYRRVLTILDDLKLLDRHSGVKAFLAKSGF